MSSTTSTPPSSFEDVYVQARSRGDSHADAVQRGLHAYSRRAQDMGDRIARVRALWDREHAEQREPLRVGDDLDAEIEQPSEPDAFAESEAEIRKRIEDLDAQRATFALDAINDPKARDKLSDIEHRLGGARLELQHVDLARAEQHRREQAEREAEEEATVDAALAQAAALQHDRERAAVRVDRAAHALGEALGKHQAIAVEQGQALIAAGRIRDLRENLAPDIAMEGALAHGLGGAAGWLELSHDATVRFAHPFAEQDVRHVEPAK
jgi:hypothetical protein